MSTQTGGSAGNYAVFVGGYTEAMDGRSPGISTFTAEGASADQVEFVAGPPVELESPSFLIKHPLQPWIYAVSEASPSQVSALRFGLGGSGPAELELINTVPSGGDGGCHLCFDRNFSFVLVAHYGSGSVACFKINEDGSLSERTGLLSFSGTGPDTERQDASHAHQVVSVGEVILVPDLGADAVHIVSIDADGALSAAGEPIRLPAGSGPRHLVLAANHLVVACELTGQLWVSPLDADLGAAGRTVPSSSRDSETRIYPSAIQAFRDQIVVANRGVGTVSFFSLQDGELVANDEVDCGGSWPRDLTLDGDRIWVSDQADDQLSVLARDSDDHWTIDFQIPTPNPACVIVARTH